jgi:GTP-binding protein HflX
VAIVGYTNAGKSTLLNALTGASVLAEDKLFATLDTRSRHLKVGWAGYGDREIVITDTVGFIRALPQDLFAAFRATFEEAADADLIVHVVDAADPTKTDHMETTLAVLEELELAAIPQVLVFNKVELLTAIDRKILQKRYPEAVLLSAEDRNSTRPLVARIAEELAERWDRSAKVPEPVETEPLIADEADPEEVHASTLEELLRAGRRRARVVTR